MECIRSGKILLDVINLFDKSGIEYCITNGYDEIPDKISSDVDIVVSREVFEKLPQILESFSIVQIVKHEVSSSCYTIIKETESEITEYIQLDFSYEFRYVFLLVPNEMLFYEREVSENGFKIPSVDIQFIFYLLKKVAKGELLGSHLEYLRKLYQKCPDKCNSHIFHYFSKYYCDLIIRIMMGSSESFPLMRLKSNYEMRLLFHYPIRCLVDIGLALFRVIGRILHPTGLHIVFLGIDGSGKSSIISNLLQIINIPFKGVNMYHFRPNIIFKEQSTSITSVVPYNKSPHSQLLSLVKIIILVLDYWAGYFVQVLPSITRTRIIIYDRDFFDVICDPLRYRINCNVNCTKVLYKLIPKPNLYLFMDVSPEILLLRKNELTLASIKRIRESYYENFSLLPNLVIVENNEELGKGVLKSQKIIFDLLKNKYISWK